jgi:hypothetical protein
MKKILCVLNTFFNYEHIKQCFDSLYNDNVDFFILENKSKYSDNIENYFKQKNIIGYLQSSENITHGTVDFFYKNYAELIKKYEYFTITDGDLYVDNINLLYEELIDILNEEKVLVCSVQLKKDNLPKIPNSEKWIPNGEIINNKFMKSSSGTHMMTFKNENFNIFLNNPIMIDTYIHKSVKEKGGISAVTLKNKATHLTWDYYTDGNEYFEWKKENQWTLLPHEKKSEMKKII